MNREHGTLYLSGGGQSWPVTYRLHFQESVRGRTDVTGTLGLPNPAVVSLQHVMRDPNEFCLLRLSDGRWVHLNIKTLPADSDNCEIVKGAHIVPPPSWAEKGAS